MKISWNGLFPLVGGGSFSPINNSHGLFNPAIVIFFGKQYKLIVHTFTSKILHKTYCQLHR